MTEDLEMVVLIRDLPESGLNRGDVGTVVHRYDGGNGYEVECVSGEGGTVAVVTLTADDIRPVACRP
jgi:hypothetical protein